MDAKPYMSGLFALAGAVIGATAAIGTQVYESRQADLRHVRGLAYEAAIEEWRIKVETIRSMGAYDSLPYFEDILLRHMAYASLVYHHAPDKLSKQKRDDFLEYLFDENAKRHDERIKKSPSAEEIHASEQDSDNKTKKRTHP
ncbi:hypothetical protein FVW20_15985 [Desulfovibrio oxamicus]|uniref:Uncharacterized protein n=2 Tax=Nitratidesulfovibrio TaxID=2802295 RepID=B8DLX8_NITV9|nr:hypothetical protein [Nitratidesulfovibrio oxamicus]MBG3878468.1 hypothetical protein [Nitratidesulfovibrio oxamicus]